MENDPSIDNPIDKVNSNRYWILIVSALGIISALIGIFAFFVKDDLVASCQLKFLAGSLNASPFVDSEGALYSAATFDPKSQMFKATIAFSEKVNFGLGDQIFSDTQRIFAVRNTTEKLIESIVSIDEIQGWYSVTVEFSGGADASGGDGYFSIPLNIGKLQISVPQPKINGIDFDQTFEFKNGQQINNVGLALVRSAFVSDIFINELYKQKNRPHISPLYLANTYNLKGPKYRYGKVDVTIVAKKKLKIFKEIPETLELACDVISYS